MVSLVHFGFAVNACSITRQDNGIPFSEQLLKGRLGFIRIVTQSVGKLVPNSKIEQVFNGHMHIALSSAPRIDVWDLTEEGVQLATVKL